MKNKVKSLPRCQCRVARWAGDTEGGRQCVLPEGHEDAHSTAPREGFFIASADVLMTMKGK